MLMHGDVMDPFMSRDTSWISMLCLGTVLLITLAVSSAQFFGIQQGYQHRHRVDWQRRTFQQHQQRPVNFHRTPTQNRPIHQRNNPRRLFGNFRNSNNFQNEHRSDQRNRNTQRVNGNAMFPRQLHQFPSRNDMPTENGASRQSVRRNNLRRGRHTNVNRERTHSIRQRPNTNTGVRNVNMQNGESSQHIANMRNSENNTLLGTRRTIPIPRYPNIDNRGVQISNVHTRIDNRAQSIPNNRTSILNRNVIHSNSQFNNNYNQISQMHSNGINAALNKIPDNGTSTQNRHNSVTANLKQTKSQTTAVQQRQAPDVQLMKLQNRIGNINDAINSISHQSNQQTDPVKNPSENTVNTNHRLQTRRVMPFHRDQFRNTNINNREVLTATQRTRPLMNAHARKDSRNHFLLNNRTSIRNQNRNDIQSNSQLKYNNNQRSRIHSNRISGASSNLKIPDNGINVGTPNQLNSINTSLKQTKSHTPPVQQRQAPGPGISSSQSTDLMQVSMMNPETLSDMHDTIVDIQAESRLPRFDQSGTFQDAQLMIQQNRILNANTPTNTILRQSHQQKPQSETAVHSDRGLGTQSAYHNTHSRQVTNPDARMIMSQNRTENVNDAINSIRHQPKQQTYPVPSPSENVVHTNHGSQTRRVIPFPTDQLSNTNMNTGEVVTATHRVKPTANAPARTDSRTHPLLNNRTFIQFQNRNPNHLNPQLNYNNKQRSQMHSNRIHATPGNFEIPDNGTNVVTRNQHNSVNTNFKQTKAQPSPFQLRQAPRPGISASRSSFSTDFMQLSMMNPEALSDMHDTIVDLHSESGLPGFDQSETFQDAQLMMQQNRILNANTATNPKLSQSHQQKHKSEISVNSNRGLGTQSAHHNTHSRKVTSPDARIMMSQNRMGNLNDAINFISHQSKQQADPVPNPSKNIVHSNHGLQTRRVIPFPTDQLSSTNMNNREEITARYGDKPTTNAPARLDRRAHSLLNNRTPVKNRNSNHLNSLFNYNNKQRSQMHSNRIHASQGNFKIPDNGKNVDTRNQHNSVNANLKQAKAQTSPVKQRQAPGPGISSSRSSFSTDLMHLPVMNPDTLSDMHDTIVDIQSESRLPGLDQSGTFPDAQLMMQQNRILNANTATNTILRQSHQQSAHLNTHSIQGNNLNQNSPATVQEHLRNGLHQNRNHNTISNMNTRLNNAIDTNFNNPISTFNNAIIQYPFMDMDMISDMQEQVADLRRLRGQALATTPRYSKTNMAVKVTTTQSILPLKGITPKSNTTHTTKSSINNIREAISITNHTPLRKPIVALDYKKTFSKKNIIHQTQPVISTPSTITTASRKKFKFNLNQLKRALKSMKSIRGKKREKLDAILKIHSLVQPQQAYITDNKNGLLSTQSESMQTSTHRNNTNEYPKVATKLDSNQPNVKNDHLFIVLPRSSTSAYSYSRVTLSPLAGTQTLATLSNPVQNITKHGVLSLKIPQSVSQNRIQLPARNTLRNVLISRLNKLGFNPTHKQKYNEALRAHDLNKNTAFIRNTLQSPTPIRIPMSIAKSINSLNMRGVHNSIQNILSKRQFNRMPPANIRNETTAPTYPVTAKSVANTVNVLSPRKRLNNILQQLLSRQQFKKRFRKKNVLYTTTTQVYPITKTSMTNVGKVLGASRNVRKFLRRFLTKHQAKMVSRSRRVNTVYATTTQVYPVTTMSIANAAKVLGAPKNLRDILQRILSKQQAKMVSSSRRLNTVYATTTQDYPVTTMSIANTAKVLGAPKGLRDLLQRILSKQQAQRVPSSRGGVNTVYNKTTKVYPVIANSSKVLGAQRDLTGLLKIMLSKQPAKRLPPSHGVNNMFDATTQVYPVTIMSINNANNVIGAPLELRHTFPRLLSRSPVKNISPSDSVKMLYATNTQVDTASKMSINNLANAPRTLNVLNNNIQRHKSKMQIQRVVPNGLINLNATSTQINSNTKMPIVNVAHVFGTPNKVSYIVQTNSFKPKLNPIIQPAKIKMTDFVSNQVQKTPTRLNDILNGIISNSQFKRSSIPPSLHVKKIRYDNINKPTSASLIPQSIQHIKGAKTSTSTPKLKNPSKVSVDNKLAKPIHTKSKSLQEILQNPSFQTEMKQLEHILGNASASITKSSYNNIKQQHVVTSKQRTNIPNSNARHTKTTGNKHKEPPVEEGGEDEDEDDNENQMNAPPSHKKQFRNNGKRINSGRPLHRTKPIVNNNKGRVMSSVIENMNAKFSSIKNNKAISRSTLDFIKKKISMLRNMKFSNNNRVTLAAISYIRTTTPSSITTNQQLIQTGHGRVSSVISNFFRKNNKRPQTKAEKLRNAKRLKAIKNATVMWKLGKLERTMKKDLYKVKTRHLNHSHKHKVIIPQTIQNKRRRTHFNKLDKGRMKNKIIRHRITVNKPKYIKRKLGRLNTANVNPRPFIMNTKHNGRRHTTQDITKNRNGIQKGMKRIIHKQRHFVKRELTTKIPSFVTLKNETTGHNNTKLKSNAKINIDILSNTRTGRSNVVEDTRDRIVPQNIDTKVSLTSGPMLLPSTIRSQHLETNNILETVTTIQNGFLEQHVHSNTTPLPKPAAIEQVNHTTPVLKPAGIEWVNIMSAPILANANKVIVPKDIVEKVQMPNSNVKLMIKAAGNFTNIPSYNPRNTMSNAMSFPHLIQLGKSMRNPTHVRSKTQIGNKRHSHQTVTLSEARNSQPSLRFSEEIINKPVRRHKHVLFQHNSTLVPLENVTNQPLHRGHVDTKSRNMIDGVVHGETSLNRQIEKNRAFVFSHLKKLLKNG